MRKEIESDLTDGVSFDDGELINIVYIEDECLEEKTDYSQGDESEIEDAIIYKRLLQGLRDEEIELLKCTEHGDLKNLAMRLNIKPNALYQRRYALIQKLKKLVPKIS